MSNKVCILGATGSIGGSTLQVMQANNFKLHSASAFNNVDKMLQICRNFEPKVVVMVDETAAHKLKQELKNSQIEVLSGAAKLAEIAEDSEVNIVMAAIVGIAGLIPTIAAVKANKKVLLANKEVLVVAGELFINQLKNSSAEILPVDSEHNAIFQCLPNNYAIGEKITGINRIILTGSGGPFFKTPLNKLTGISPKQAVNHPNWQMGEKISVDSATMMNKGLEWVEAKFLFGVASEKLEIVVHPESIIHSMVEYEDNSILAQLGASDMKIPIAHCLGFPKRINSTTQSLDFTKINGLSFFAPDKTQFPALKLIEQGWKKGGTALTTLNAANEVAVAAFLQSKIKFPQIMQVVEQSLNDCVSVAAVDLSTILNQDKLARKTASDFINHL